MCQPVINFPGNFLHNLPIPVKPIVVDGLFILRTKTLLMQLYRRILQNEHGSPSFYKKCYFVFDILIKKISL